MTEVFKIIKKDLKKSFENITECEQDFPRGQNVSKYPLQQLLSDVEKIRKELTNSDQLMRKFRDQQNELRITFFSLEYSVENLKDQANTNQNARYKLMNNHQEINKQGDQIHDIKSLGMETVQLMRSANQDQYQQRDGLMRIASTNQKIALDIQQADHITKQISRAELRQKMIQYAIIFLLALSIILILFMRIIR
eukprot:403357174